MYLLMVISENGKNYSIRFEISNHDKANT